MFDFRPWKFLFLINYLKPRRDWLKTGFILMGVWGERYWECGNVLSNSWCNRITFNFQFRSHGLDFTFKYQVLGNISSMFKSTHICYNSNVPLFLIMQLSCVHSSSATTNNSTIRSVEPTKTKIDLVEAVSIQLFTEHEAR